MHANNVENNSLFAYPSNDGQACPIHSTRTVPYGFGIGSSRAAIKTRSQAPRLLINLSIRKNTRSLELSMNRANSSKVGIYECFLQSNQGENIQVCLIIQGITSIPKSETSVSADLILTFRRIFLFLLFYTGGPS